MDGQNNSLILADGSLLEDSVVSLMTGGVAQYSIGGKDMAECFAIFSKTEKVCEVTGISEDRCVRYTGFTELESIRKETGILGEERVCIRMNYPMAGPFCIEGFPVIRNEEDTESTSTDGNLSDPPAGTEVAEDA